MTTEDIEQWIRMAKASGKAERVPSLIQMDKLKKENRSLLTDKIKLESEVWALSPNKDADSKMTLLEQKVAEVRAIITVSLLWSLIRGNSYNHFCQRHRASSYKRMSRLII